MNGVRPMDLVKEPSMPNGPVWRKGAKTAATKQAKERAEKQGTEKQGEEKQGEDRS